MIRAAQLAFTDTLPKLIWAIVICALWIAYIGIPASLWLKVDRIHVEDAVAGSAPLMTVDRQIVRPFKAKWRVEIERQSTLGGFTFVDYAEGQNIYALDSRLPDPLDMDWWTYRTQFRPSPGRYRIETCWTILLTVIQDRRLCITSNVFTIRAG